MVKIDFSTLQGKYPLLDSEDISFLNDFFNRSEILEKFLEIEKKRKKKLLIFYIIGTLVFSGILYFFLKNLNDFSSENIFVIIIIEAVSLFITYRIIGFFFNDPFRNIKSEIFPKFASEINKDLKYDSGKKYYFGEEGILLFGKLLKNYDRIDLIEDSIFFEPVMDFLNQNKKTQQTIQVQINSLDTDLTNSSETEIIDNEESEKEIYIPKENVPYTIEGYEFKSSERHKDKNGREYYTVSNHCYIIKITFNNARRRFESGISLLKDINDNLILKSLKVASIDAIIIAGYFYFSQPKHGNNIGMELLIYLSGVIKVPLDIFCITIVIVMYIITYQIYTLLINKGRVKTENTQFEKEFDVYSEDQVKSREVLTPSFMYKIFDFVNKISKKRVYEFYFSDNNIYIKLNLLSVIGSATYLEVSSSANVKKNMTQFVNFYLELKNVIGLSYDLGLEYFDKDTFENKIIN